MLRGRLRRRGGGESSAEPAPTYIEIDAAQLTGIVRVPNWLRDAGLLAWLLVGIGLLVFSLVWLLGLTQVIVGPLIAAGLVASVASPLLRYMEAHRVPRGIGSALILLAFVVAM